MVTIALAAWGAGRAGASRARAEDPAAPITSRVLAACRAYTALEAALEADTRGESERPAAVRPPLQGAPVDGDALERLDAVRRSGDVPHVDGATDELFEGHVVPRVAGGELPELAGDLERLRVAFAPTIAAVRSAIQATRVAREGARENTSDRAGELRVGFVLEAVHALAAGEALEAARLTTDLWRVQDDLERAGLHVRRYAHGGSLHSATPEALLALAIPKLGPRELDAIDLELSVLESSPPSLAARVRGRRLAVGAHYREQGRASADPRLERGVVDLTDMPPEAEGFPTQERHVAARIATVAKLWAREDRVLRLAESALASLSRPVAWATFSNPSAREAWSGIEEIPDNTPEPLATIVADLDDQLGCIALLRDLHVLVEASRYRTAHGAWPTSLAQALGREPGPREQSPFDASPVGLEAGADGLVVFARAPASAWGARSVRVSTRDGGGAK